MVHFNRLARKIHRILSYVIFAQLSLWILGGLTFAVLPFDSVVKGGAVLAPQTPEALPDGWTDRLAEQAAVLGGVDGVATVQSSRGPLIELRAGDRRTWIRPDTGAVAKAPGAEEIGHYAGSLYTGAGSLQGTRLIEAPEYRMAGLVDEMYGRTGVWQVSFDDRYGTRLYFDRATGRFLTARNDYWVLYDAMWRLHIMDYRGGEDFNNILLRLFTPLALLFAVAGLCLTWTSARRTLARRVRRATTGPVT